MALRRTGGNSFRRQRAVTHFLVRTSNRWVAVELEQGCPQTNSHAGGNLKFRAVVPTLFAILFLSASSTRAQFPPAPGTGPGLPETIEAIDSARVTTRILYITAHPDDESATLLTYLARGLHARVALLTLTRGEGGQNDLGPEQAPQLGLIRTEELLAATRGYGIELYFGRARDFGFSKTTEETQKVWGDPVLGDMVRVIRTFRPDIVINGWGGVKGGHGHHVTSGLWTPRAVALAADPEAFPEQLENEGLSTWGSSFKPIPILDTERGGATSSNGYALPVDEISPLWGKSWRDIALDAFSNHRSQGITGFLNSPFLRRPLVLIREDGAKLDPAILAREIHEIGDVDQSKAAVAPALRDAEAEIGKARNASLSLHWEEAAKEMSAAAKNISSVASTSDSAHPASDLHFNLGATLRRIDHALALMAGIQFRAESDRENLVVGESFNVTAESRCRDHADCTLGALTMVLPPKFTQEATKQDPASKAWQFKIQVHGPAPVLSAWAQQQPEPPPFVFARQQVTVDGYAFSIDLPVTNISANSTHINRVPLRIVPAYTLAVEPKQKIEALAKSRKPFDVLLRVHSYATQPGKVNVGLDAPQGWTTTAPVQLGFPGASDQYAKLTVTPPQKLSAGNSTITAYALRGDEKFSTSLEPLPSLPTTLWSEPAEIRIHAFDINVPENLRVGYISSEGEPVPEALERLGIKVEMLDAAALNFSDLTKFNAIVVGIRAFELRPELPGANQRLLDYVSGGGTLLVQYQRDFAWDKFQYAPYPAKIDPGKQGAPLPRITDESSPVKFLKPDDPLLNIPNKITQDDFKGWTQERGLYFWSQFDDKYTPLLIMNDPGEPDLNGALVYAHVGKGTYIYTGIAFFRQLPEGVPGAYRLFVNLLSASHSAK
jgi:LmbE family N-acetylglucosaminyl deacetylase